MRKKLIGSILVVMILLGSIAPVTNVSAKTLAESFSGGTYLTKTYTGSVYTYFCSKSAWAKTIGYYKNHYVRAYVGGSSSSANGAIADTGRQYSSGDIKRTATTDKVLVQYNKDLSLFFPMGYAKYGSN